MTKQKQCTASCYKTYEENIPIDNIESEVTIVQIANAEVKRQKLTHEGRTLSAYQSMLHVLATSNIAERLFSRAELIPHEEQKFKILAF